MQLLSFLMLAAALPALLLAAEDPAPNIGVCGADPAAQVLTVPVRVSSSTPADASKLQWADFVVKDHRVAQRTCGLARVSGPVSVGIVLDMSGSMKALRGLDPIGLGKGALLDLLAQARPPDEFLLVEASTAPVLKCGFSSNLDCILSSPPATPYGRTALIDAIHLALDAMRGARYQNRSLVVGDNRSTHTISELSRELSESGIPLFLIALTDLWNRGSATQVEQTQRENLLRLASESGGYAALVLDKRSAGLAANQIDSAIRLVYSVYFVPAPSWQAHRQHDLRIAIQKAGLRATPLYRTRYKDAPVQH